MSDPTDLDDVVLATPEAAFRSLEEDATHAGGPWTPPSGYEGSVGRTMFDTPSSKDGTVTVLLPQDSIDVLPSQALVRIESLRDGRTYLGAVVEGPFAEPDGLRADSTPMVVTTVKGGLLMPQFHGRAQIEIIGEQLAEGLVVPPRRRPKPNSPVFALDAAETARVLKVQGDLRLGLADGLEDLEVCVPARSKSVFPRHLGVLGTTGGGKSTTVAGLIAKAQQQQMAVVLIDTEGEYCALHEPAEKAEMVQALSRRGLDAAGVPHTHVYHLVGRDVANAGHPSKTAFTLRFSDLSPYAVQEILELNEAQSERFFKAYDITKMAMERFKIWPRSEPEKAQAMELDELESGYPTMTLSHLHDVIRQIAARDDSEDADPPNLETATLRQRRADLQQIIRSVDPPKNVASWRAVMGKIGRLKRLSIFDSCNAKPLDYSRMLQPGHVSILDLSDTESPQVNNLVIAALLKGVQDEQEARYQAAVKDQRPPTPALVFIEEAHEFLSAHRIKKMEVLFQQVAKIARRGRKRWLGLVFITQLPQHLPDEVLGLVNNWILHKVGDAGVVSRLRRAIGGIHESLWRHLPSLAPGQAVVSFTTFARPLLVSIDPSPAKLLMVE